VCAAEMRPPWGLKCCTRCAMRATACFVDVVFPDSPASRAGLQPYDVIRKFNDVPFIRAKIC